MIYDLIIIGFGISGISLAKESVKRNKKILILEKNTNFGGVWFKCNNTTCLQTHKDYYEFNNEESMFSNVSSYPNKKEILLYLEKILDKYNLNNHVIYNYLVKKIERKNNIYIIDNKYETKYIGICSGYNNNPKIISELDSFNGAIIHSSNIKHFDFSTIKKKNICVIGNGASACDIIKNIDNVNKNIKILNIYKTPKYFIDKYIFNIPISYFLNEFILIFFKKINIFIYRIILKLINFIFFNNTLNIPFSKINSNNLIASNIINNKIQDNSLIYVQDNIKFSLNKSLICNNNIFLNIDIIFLCNGYNSKPSFLEKIPEKRLLGIFNKKYKNIGFIGFNPSYNWPKISEKQSVLFLDFIDKKLNINKKYYKKIDSNDFIIDSNDFTYNMYDYLKL